MATHKLGNGPLIITVTDARIVEGNFGTQIKFEGEAMGSGGEVDVYVNEQTAVKQLERLAMDIHTCVGETLHMEQVKKDGRTYTNFRRITNDQAARIVHEAVVPASEASAPAHGVEGVLETYKACIRGAVGIARGLEEAGYEVSSDNLVAMAATIFIQASRR